MYVSVSGRQTPRILARPVNDPKSTLGDITVALSWDTTVYLTVSEATELVGSLHAALDEIRQRDCPHPLDDVASLDPFVCGRCGGTPAPSDDENVL